jgi:DNA replicative helicase MCM subunit Mcm2 (Cdc46/Mcm family)
MSEELQMEQRLHEVTEAHKRALRQLAKRDAAREELVAAVYQAAKDAALSITIPPVPAPKASGKKGEGETLVVLLGDWQLGKYSESYSIDVAKARIALLATKVQRLIELHGVPVKEIACVLLGDFVESDGNIFPSQAYEVERGGLYVQIFEGAGMLAQFVRAMAALAPKVTVRGAIGNHGRLGTIR